MPRTDTTVILLHLLASMKTVASDANAQRAMREQEGFVSVSETSFEQRGIFLDLSTMIPYKDLSQSNMYHLDVNECERGIAGCHSMAMCINQPGSCGCKCIHGFTGDGTQCNGELTGCSTNNLLRNLSFIWK